MFQNPTASYENMCYGKNNLIMIILLSNRKLHGPTMNLKLSVSLKIPHSGLLSFGFKHFKHNAIVKCY